MGKEKREKGRETIVFFDNFEVEPECISYFKYEPLPSLQVVKTVYASPSRVDFHLDSRKKASDSISSYFNFAVVIQFLRMLRDTITDFYTGSRDNTCISRYLFCS